MHAAVPLEIFGGQKHALRGRGGRMGRGGVGRRGRRGRVIIHCVWKGRDCGAADFSGYEEPVRANRVRALRCPHKTRKNPPFL